MWDGMKSILFMWHPISLTCVRPPFCTRFVSLSIPTPVSVSDSQPRVVGKSISVAVRSLKLITDRTDQLNGAEHVSWPPLNECRLYYLHRTVPYID